MNARYFNEPPSLPDYFYRHYTVRAFRALISWSKKEYDDAVRLFSKRGAMKTVKYLNEEYSAMRVLAEMPGFRRIVSLLNENNYNLLDARERQFIRRAYEINEHLRKSKLLV